MLENKKFGVISQKSRGQRKADRSAERAGLFADGRSFAGGDCRRQYVRLSRIGEKRIDRYNFRVRGIQEKRKIGENSSDGMSAAEIYRRAVRPVDGSGRFFRYSRLRKNFRSARGLLCGKRAGKLRRERKRRLSRGAGAYHSASLCLS